MPSEIFSRGDIPGRHKPVFVSPNRQIFIDDRFDALFELIHSEDLKIHGNQDSKILFSSPSSSTDTAGGNGEKK